MGGAQSDGFIFVSEILSRYKNDGDLGGSDGGRG